MSDQFKEIINSIRIEKDGQKHRVAFETPKSIRLNKKQLELLYAEINAAIDEAKYLSEQTKIKNGGVK